MTDDTGAVGGSEWARLCGEIAAARERKREREKAEADRFARERGEADAAAAVIGRVMLRTARGTLQVQVNRPAAPGRGRHVLEVGECWRPAGAQDWRVEVYLRIGVEAAGEDDVLYYVDDQCIPPEDVLEFVAGVVRHYGVMPDQA